MQSPWAGACEQLADVVNAACKILSQSLFEKKKRKKKENMQLE